MLKFLLLVLPLLLLPDFSTACCCTINITNKCGCNIFGCNCDTRVDKVTGVDGYCLCWEWENEFCPDRKRRKRSLHEAISEAYSGLYPENLIELGVMENFFSFDLDQDGLISLEEAMEGNNSNNGTEEGFKQVDLDNDGFVKPSEFDSSLY